MSTEQPKSKAHNRPSHHAKQHSNQSHPNPTSTKSATHHDSSKCNPNKPQIQPNQSKSPSVGSSEDYDYCDVSDEDDDSDGDVSDVDDELEDEIDDNSDDNDQNDLFPTALSTPSAPNTVSDKSQGKHAQSNPNHPSTGNKFVQKQPSYAVAAGLSSSNNTSSSANHTQQNTNGQSTTSNSTPNTNANASPRLHSHEIESNRLKTIQKMIYDCKINDLVLFHCNDNHFYTKYQTTIKSAKPRNINATALPTAQSNEFTKMTTQTEMPSIAITINLPLFTYQQNKKLESIKTTLLKAKVALLPEENFTADTFQLSPPPTPTLGPLELKDFYQYQQLSRMKWCYEQFLASPVAILTTMKHINDCKEYFLQQYYTNSNTVNIVYPGNNPPKYHISVQDQLVSEYIILYSAIYKFQYGLYEAPNCSRLSPLLSLLRELYLIPLYYHVSSKPMWEQSRVLKFLNQCDHEINLIKHVAQNKDKEVITQLQQSVVQQYQDQSGGKECDTKGHKVTSAVMVDSESTSTLSSPINAVLYKEIQTMCASSLLSSLGNPQMPKQTKPKAPTSTTSKPESNEALKTVAKIEDTNESNNDESDQDDEKDQAIDDTILSNDEAIASEVSSALILPTTKIQQSQPGTPAQLQQQPLGFKFFLQLLHLHSIIKPHEDFESGISLRSCSRVDLFMTNPKLIFPTILQQFVDHIQPLFCAQPLSSSTLVHRIILPMINDLFIIYTILNSYNENIKNKKVFVPYDCYLEEIEDNVEREIERTKRSIETIKILQGRRQTHRNIIAQILNEKYLTPSVMRLPNTQNDQNSTQTPTPHPTSGKKLSKYDRKKIKRIKLLAEKKQAKVDTKIREKDEKRVYKLMMKQQHLLSLQQFFKDNGFYPPPHPHHPHHHHHHHHPHAALPPNMLAHPHSPHHSMMAPPIHPGHLGHPHQHPHPHPHPHMSQLPSIIHHGFSMPHPPSMSPHHPMYAYPPHCMSMKGQKGFHAPPQGPYFPPTQSYRHGKGPRERHHHHHHHHHHHNHNNHHGHGRNYHHREGKNDQNGSEFKDQESNDETDLSHEDKNGQDDREIATTDHKRSTCHSKQNSNKSSSVQLSRCARPFVPLSAKLPSQQDGKLKQNTPMSTTSPLSSTSSEPQSSKTPSPSGTTDPFDNDNNYRQYENAHDTPLPAPPLQISFTASGAQSGNVDGTTTHISPSSPSSPPLQSNAQYSMFPSYPPPHLSATQLPSGSYFLQSSNSYGIPPPQTYTTTTLPMLFPTGSSDLTGPGSSVVGTTPSLDANKSPQLNTHASPTILPAPQAHHVAMGQSISPFGALTQAPPPMLLPITGQLNPYPGYDQTTLHTPLLPPVASSHLLPMNIMPYTGNTLSPQTTTDHLDGHD